jgi:hypothetical protein
MKITDEFLKVKMINEYVDNNPSDFTILQLNPSFIISTESTNHKITIQVKTIKEQIDTYVIHKRNKTNRTSFTNFNIIFCIVTEEEFNRIYDILK